MKRAQIYLIFPWLLLPLLLALSTEEWRDPRYIWYVHGCFFPSYPPPAPPQRMLKGSDSQIFRGPEQWQVSLISERSLKMRLHTFRVVCLPIISARQWKVRVELNNAMWQIIACYSDGHCTKLFNMFPCPYFSSVGQQRLWMTRRSYPSTLGMGQVLCCRPSRW